MREFVTAKNITHIYQSIQGETLAVDDISFRIEKGEFIAIVGPSGCGKTTLLSILSGMLTPTSGEVTINSAPASIENVGYMLQHDHLLDWQTIRTNALLGLKVRHKLTKQAEHYTDTLIESYGLSDFAHSYPGQLSGGMRQKAALIRTLALKPEILLLDEPFSALDFQTRITAADEVYKIIRDEHKTAILVTHDISEAISLADRVFVLTKRPARLLDIHEIELCGKTPLERRSEPQSGEYFDIIWNELSGGEQHENRS